MDAKNKELVFATVHCIIAIVAALLMIKGQISEAEEMIVFHKRRAGPSLIYF